MSIGVLGLCGWIAWWPINILTFGLQTNNMTEQEKKDQIQQTLDYMIAEGMVVETKPGFYRLKTERELEQEMALLDD
jgi:hypothetical protein